MKSWIISFLITLIVLSNSTIVLCGSGELFQYGMIHLETGTPEKKYLNISETKSHQYWIYLESDKTYSIEVDPSPNSSEADLHFNFSSSDGLICNVDKVSKGLTEKYEYPCNKSGKYYIEVFSDISAYYTITVRDITYSDEIFLILLVACLLYVLYYTISKTKRKKKEITQLPKSRLGRFFSNDYVQLFLFIWCIIGIIYMILDFLNYI